MERNQFLMFPRQFQIPNIQLLEWPLQVYGVCLEQWLLLKLSFTKSIRAR